MRRGAGSWAQGGHGGLSGRLTDRPDAELAPARIPGSQKTVAREHSLCWGECVRPVCGRACASDSRNRLYRAFRSSVHMGTRPGAPPSTMMNSAAYDLGYIQGTLLGRGDGVVVVECCSLEPPLQARAIKGALTAWAHQNRQQTKPYTQ